MDERIRLIPASPLFQKAKNTIQADGLAREPLVMKLFDDQRLP
jgi:hypothetical protein